MSSRLGTESGQKSSPDVKTTTYQVPFGGAGTLDLLVEERGEGRPFLLLHGGAGPMSMARFAGMLAARGARVITPTHPGFSRTRRPDSLNSVRALAQIYAAFLDQIDSKGVTVVGNSVGGWIAAELALAAAPRLSAAVLVGATGVDVPGHPIADTSKLSLDEIISRSYHDAKPFRIDPTTMTDEQRAVMGANRAALAAYAPRLTDPTLAGRLAKVSIPVLVISGESDRIVDPEYARGYAAIIPGARFLLLPGTGHLPQLETPGQLLEAVWGFGPSISGEARQ